MQRIRLWDLPTRLFHWLLVCAIGAAWFTGEQGGTWLIWHGRIGLGIVGLVIFRLCWGFLGSSYARFSTFVRGPATIIAYLKGQWHGIGHNPLGALSVLALLALVAAQAGSGLFAEGDDIGYTGFLYPLVSSDISHLLTKLHHKVFDILLLFIGLHITAILFYTHIKKDNLLTPMVTGWKVIEVPQSPHPPSKSNWSAFILSLIISAGAVCLVSGSLLSKPTLVVSTPANTTPNW